MENKVITDQTIQLIRSMVEGESEYLESRFGRDFLDRTK
jgi:hypothetical protein